MSSHQPPAHLRYLKARLRPLLRPQVWGTILFLLAVSTLAGIYFAHLEEFTAEENQDNPTLSNDKSAENQTAQSNINPEDRAIAADIDISTVLENDLATNTETLDAAPDKPRENIFEQYMKQRQAKDKAATSSGEQANQQAGNLDYNPFSVKFSPPNSAGRNNAETSTNSFLPNLSGNNSSGLNSTNSTSTSLNNTNALQTALDRANGYSRGTNVDANGNAINPLQAALDRQSLAQTNYNLIAQPNQLTPLLGTVPYTGVTTIIPNSGVPIQGTVPLTPYSNISGNATQTIPIPTTGVTSNINNPGLTNNPINSYTYLNQPQVPNTTQTLPSTSGVTNSNIPNSAVQTTPNQVQNTPAPFSIPNNPPGRTIGGGQINTFSNP
ncbi:hypothetical protein ACE1CA_11710 [Aerosakkonemataceae cyanobacterium BLCC-F167]|uniref:Uncharacterized protein n=2 Tax=Floridanema TaxID=3396149 RepID=A0ABV4WKJ9_9CYAN